MAFKVSGIAKYLRPIVQTASLSIVIWLFLTLAYPLNMPWSNPLLAADPFNALASILYSRGSFIPVLLLVGVLLIGSALLGRVFCGWICPVGFLIDLSGTLSAPFSKLLKKKPVRDRFGYLQYGILAAAILFSLITLDLLAVLDPFVIFQRSLVTVYTAAGVPIVLLLILIGSIVIAPRFWCRAICPSGALIGAASVPSPFKFKMEKDCKRCMKCYRACPMGALSNKGSWDATACIKCLKCEDACPDDKISFAPSVPDVPAVSLTRRSMLAAGAAMGLFAVSKGMATAAASSDQPLIRPPGSLVEVKFNAACARCESCVKACLGNVIRPAGLDKGLDRYYTPALDFLSGKCERCGSCGQVCPTGAIVSIPEEEIKIGTAVINEETCLEWTGNKKCLVCKEVCPVDAVVQTGRRSGTHKPVVDKDLCIGCGACEHECPLEEKAVIITNEGERRRA